MKNIETRKAVDTLLAQYSEYMEIHNKLEEVNRMLAKSKLAGKVDLDIEEKHNKLTDELQYISDSMTFATPEIWMTYKYEAYKDDPQSIRSMHDFRQHCSKKDYICTKRFTFIESELNKKGLTSLFSYNDDMDLIELINSSDIKELQSDPLFREDWNKYEYYRIGDKVSKWENWDN